ncbi:hypothetical protein GHT06_010889 [Daphnia sinensis]|uniref:Helicase c-terminal domain containing protein n=1 Tax=Daphnia sinensis TaxID=1820382 RepID=A0AAD5LIP7_9CRUS|nr:hypothetical protein GHT06_010889 [Daphnia sinensis]
MAYHVQSKCKSEEDICKTVENEEKTNDWDTIMESEKLIASSSISSRRYETLEDVFQEILNWIQDANTDVKLAENAISHISSKVERALKPWETTYVESQYVKALLTTWAETSLKKAFSYLEDDTTDISEVMANILDELDSINSVEDINTKLNEETSQLWTWMNGGRPYIQLILEQEDLFKNTPRFVTLLNQYFSSVKRCFINRVFSRCEDEIISGGVSSSPLKEFLSALTDLLTHVNEDKNLQDVVKNYMREKIRTTSSQETDEHVINDGLSDSSMEEFLSELNRMSGEANEDDDISDDVKNQVFQSNLTTSSQETDGQESNGMEERVIKLIQLVRTALHSESDNKKSVIPELVQRFESSSSKIRSWSPQLELLINETCKKFLLPETVVDVRMEYGRRFIFISGVAVFVRDWQDAGESGGHVHITCNEIIGAERWTIASNGGDGGSTHEWSLEEFKKAFSPILPPDRDMKKEKVKKQVSDQPEIKDLYDRLEKNLEKEFEHFFPVKDGPMQDQCQARSTRSARLADGSEMTYSLYENRNKKRHTPILCKGFVSQGGYGGDIILELSSKKERGVPPIGMEMYQAMGAEGVVYKATGSDGKMEQANGDVGYIHNEEKTSEGNYVGFGIGQSLKIQYLKKKKLKKDEVASYVKVHDVAGNPIHATIVLRDVRQKEKSSLPLTGVKKKNAINRQSLVRHFSMIKERKQILESLRKTLMSDLLEENRLQNIDQWMEEIRNNEILFGDQVSQQLSQEKVVFTRPAPVVSSRAARETKGEWPINLRQKEEEEEGKRNLKLNDKLVPYEKQIERLFKLIENKRASAKRKIITETWSGKFNLSFWSFTPDDRDLCVNSLAVFLYDFECALQQLRKPEDNNFQLRDYQIEAILELIIQINEETERTLAEISTGAGKSLIVAASAIALVRGHGLLTHVITSNDLLAIRDSNLSVAEGGLKDIYEYFNVQVANNCSPSEDERRASYTARVVYGQLANFQRDYLLDKFYGRKICGTLEVKNVIIDEVDCMLLDQGNNTLYLSHDIPDMETLESLYVFIWDEICNSTIKKAMPDYREQVKKSIKSDVLFDLYGVITKKDLLDYVHAPLDNSEKRALWKHLIKKQVIDRNGRLLIDDVDKITEKMINYIPENKELQRKNLNAKLVFYLRQVANRQRRIRIPAHLLDFVDRHLDTWLESAFQALDLRPDEDYVIDQDRTDTSPDLNPQVIIIDPDTGTDQMSSQWDGGLHQFIQLKEGCKLTLQSLKAVFISNATYINQYPNIFGVSGTLGSEQEQHFLQETFKCSFYRNRSLIPKRFEPKTARVLSTEDEWLNAIITETETVIAKKRSIVIFCKSIKDVNVVQQRLKKSIPELTEENRLHRYTRDYVKFAFERTELGIGHVIVATNLAGRGTDIKISHELRDNGGLHVCLSYFPENQRIEEQAMGRTARNGAPGSGILIVYKPITCEERAPDEKELIDIMKSERAFREKQRIAETKKGLELMKDQEELFDLFSKYYTNLKEELRKTTYGDQTVSAICGSVLDQWALWLDEMNGCPLDVTKYSYSEKFIPKLKEKLKLKDNLDISQIDWMAPARSVIVAKHLATRNEKPDLPMAAEILEKLIQSKDRHFYPTAFYYRAFILLKENYETNKNEFIKTLRTCENVLNEHINMQISLFSSVQTTKRKIEQPFSFCVVDGYTQQKENMINLFQYFLGSVRSLLGTDCSIEDFETAGQLTKTIKGFFDKNLSKFEKWIKHEHENFKVFQEEDKNIKESMTIPAEKVEKYFKLLLEGESKCVGHQLNDASTIPSWNSSFEQHAKTNQQLAIERIANAYGVSAFTLDKSLSQAVETALSKEAIEEAIEKKMKNKFKEDHLIPCTRESFWAKLVETGALYNNRNFVSVDECNVDTFNLNREQAKTFPFDDKDCVIYNPVAVNGKNGQEKKIFFTQKYVEDKLYGHSTKNINRDQLQFNKIAKVDVVKLKSIDLKLFGQLTDDDLREADITPAECQEIMAELIKQDIIDDDGNLSSNYNGQRFKYPNCPAYEDPVMRLVGSKFRAEIVRRQWLESKNNSNRLEAINLLPLTPYRDMLDELVDAYVISGGVRVNRMDERVLERKVKEITEKDHERECILDFLKGRQAVYEATWLTSQEAALDFIDGDIRKVKANTFESELGLFRLMGFDHVIYMKDRQMSSKQMVLSTLLTPLVIIGGVASISAGAVLTLFSQILPFRVAKDVLLMGGISDILFFITTVLSNDPIRFPDYARQRIRSATGKSNLVDQVKTLWKLRTPGQSAGNNFRPAVRLQMDSFHQRRVREKNPEADQREIVKALLQLKRLSTNPSEEDDDELV